MLNEDSSEIDVLTFICLQLNYKFPTSNGFVAAGIPMTLQTDPVFYPSGEGRVVVGRCSSLTGIKGAKIAIVACDYDLLREKLKRIYSNITLGTVPLTLAGGAYALDNSINRGDCVITNDGDPSTIKDRISYYSKFGVKQIDFERGNTTFVQGEFSFPSFGSAKAFKAQICDPINDAGMMSILHTYSYYLDYNAKEILSNPKWQQQLEFKESFTLAEEVTPETTELIIRDVMCKADEVFKLYHTPYLLVDNEIIKYSLGENGFTSCRRGQCGTKKAYHSAGSVVKIIGGQFGCIAPQIGSDLYYEIARRIASAYNEGGFSGIYFDAYDGLEAHLENAGLGDYLWYFGAAFVNEVLKYCDRQPLVEFSAMNPSVWAARGRGGAWDYPSRGYKNFIDDHLLTNRILKNRFYVTTLGWYNFYPVLSEEPGNYSTKYMFFDDVDYVGAKGLAYDQTMVYNGLKEEIVNALPALKRNLDNYSRYNRLRTKNYFSDKVKSIIQEAKYEYKLEHHVFRWGFREAYYCRKKIRDAGNEWIEGNNPFSRQKPFVRLENIYSSDCGAIIPLLAFDDSIDFAEQRNDVTFSKPLDLSNHKAIRVRIKGHGKKSKDALCVRLSFSSSSGVADFVTKLDFEGWKDIFLTDLDNAENTELEFQGMPDPTYRTHIQKIDMSKVKTIQLYKSGECKGVRIKRIDAIPLKENPLTNPTINLGEASITFVGTIESGEYVEYKVGQRNATIYDRIGNNRQIRAERKGHFEVPKGDFEATVTGESALDNAPVEVVLTFGFYGKFIHN